MDHRDYLKFLSGHSNKEENKKLFEWISEKESHLHHLKKVQKAYEKMERRHVNHSFVSEDWKKVNKRLSTQKSLKTSYKKAILLTSSVAATLLLFFSLFHFPHKPVVDPVTYLCFEMPNGSQGKMTLNDSTVVWLGPGSHLKVPSSFNGDTRMVELKGEALFEVTHDPKHPFVVKTPLMDVTALGTTFNVKAYENEPAVETFLVEGKIQVDLKNKKTSAVKSCILKPTEKISFSKKKKSYLISTYQPSSDLAWKNKRISFRNEPLEGILRKMERFYDVQFNIQDSSIIQNRYSGDFDRETVTEALKALQNITPFSWKKSEETIFINSKR